MAKDLYASWTEIEFVEYAAGDKTKYFSVGLTNTRKGTVARITVDALEGVTGYRIRIYTDKDGVTPYTTIFTNYVEMVHAEDKK